MPNCLQCGSPLSPNRQGPPKKYCSQQCSSRAFHERRQASGRKQTRTLHERVCVQCGKRWATVKAKAQYCSNACISRATAGSRKPAARTMAKPTVAKPPVAAQCAWCLALKFTHRKFCSPVCEAASALTRAREQRSALRAAYEDGDHQSLIAAIYERSKVDGNGCWVWTRRVKDGYAIVQVGTRTIPVHRMVLEAKHGQGLGSQHAHHICANSQCVNPDHLQPVTHRDNVAEMLARQSYLSRIAELEAALEEVAPHHPLLRLVRVA